MRKSLLHFSAIILFLLFSSCTGVAVSEKNCKVSHGIVKDITEGGVNDAVFHLSDNDTVFYINRALENGFSLGQLKKDAENKKVSIYYIPSSSILSITPIQSQNIYRIDVGEKVLYSKF